MTRLHVLLVVIALAIPVGTFLGLPHVPAQRVPALVKSPVQVSFAASVLPLRRATIGRPPQHKPLITHVKIFDLDNDGLRDVLACDAVLGRVIWCRQAPRGTWTEHVLGDVDLASPCHVSPADLNGDGHLDLAVAVLGSVYPADEPIGKVVWLESDGQQNFRTRVIIDDLRRVADVQVGDLNGDRLPDLAVAEFGFDRGRVLWLENKGRGEFRDRELLASPGAIHVPLVDLNGDGKLEIATVISQEEEEVIAFENLGDGPSQRRSLHALTNFDFGSSGLFVNDLDRDGLADLLLTGGDNLEITSSTPQPWHGCLLLRNKGKWKFEVERLATVPGVYAAAVGDLNADGHSDVVLASMFNDWHQPGSASLSWVKNDGRGMFSTWQIDSAPSHLGTVAVGDLDGDGRDDIVAGSLHLLGPYDRLGRITIWTSRKGTPP